MRVRYAVTFEFELRPPLTHRGEMSGGTPATCCARAVREAQRELKPYRWSSMNCVVLERLDADAETDDAPTSGSTSASDDAEDDDPATPPARE